MIERNGEISIRARRWRGVMTVQILAGGAVIGVVTAVAVAMFHAAPGTRLSNAAQQLLEDLAFGRQASMQEQRVPHVVVFSLDTERYHVAIAADPDKPVERLDGTVCQADFRTGRLSDVVMRISSMGGDARLGFGAYGQLDQVSDAVIALTLGKETVEIHIDARTGDTSLAVLGP